jgi:hypothetical protein
MLQEHLDNRLWKSVYDNIYRIQRYLEIDLVNV